jgi:H+-transporting ATPase
MMNALVGWHEEMKAGDAVAALASQLAPEASVKRDGKWIVAKGRDLVPGDLVVLALGGAVPADCTLLEGKQIRVDQAALTGESLPVAMETGHTAKMGSSVTNGEIEAIVTASGGNTFFGKTAALLASVNEKSNLEKVLDKTLVIICSVGAPMILVIIVILATRGYSFFEILTEAVVLIVAIVPIANAVVCTSTLAFGARELSEDGAIVTRLSSIEEMAGMNCLCSDKTGTDVCLFVSCFNNTFQVP